MSAVVTGIQFCSSFLNSLFLLRAKLYKSINCIIKIRLSQQLTVANKEFPSDDVNILAHDLYRAILSIHYKRIEQLVRKGREKGLLNEMDVEGNTFIHLVAYYLNLQTRHENIPDIDDSAPFIQEVINIVQSSFLHLC